MTTTVVSTIDEASRRKFEAAWRESRPRIEDFLPPEGDPQYEATLLELVAIDLELSWRAGTERTADEYIARFAVLQKPEHVRTLAREEELVRRAAKHALKPGSRVGRYRLLGVHARGGFGVVWRAQDDNLGREVALKTLAQPRDADARQRFVAEARVASRLEHPGVVPVHELTEDDVPWYSMKLVRGQTLAELMRAYREARTPLAWHRLLEVFLAVARAVGFAHTRGHMHRDIKPDNIVVGDFGETVLLDWGLARAIAGPLEAEGTVMGTPGYMPPEQAEGRVASHDTRSDVYALGVMLGEILALDRKAARSLRAIARKATSPAPDDRYVHAGEVALDVERYLSNERVTAHVEAWWEKLGRSMRRHRTRWAVGIASTVLAIAGTAVALWIARDAELRRQRDVYAEAVRDETRARGALAAGRPADAVSALDEALGELANEDGLASTRARIAAMRDRASRLATFATSKEAAWFLSGEERDKLAQLEIEAALGAVGPKCEAAIDLPAERIAECRRAMHGLMLLDAVLLAKAALAQPLLAGRACKEAFVSLERARTEGPTSFGDLVQSLCSRLTTDVPAPKQQTPQANPIDAHLFGIAYLYVGAIPEGLKAMLGPVLTESGLDLRNPLASSIDRFREAVRLEPNEYWHSFMLANALAAAGDYRAAGLVLEHCVALRPDYPRGLEARGQNAVLQGLYEQREDLVALGKADFARALAIAPYDPWTHWARAQLARTLRQPAEQMTELATALALDPDALWRTLPVAHESTSLSTAPEAQFARDEAALLLQAQADNALAWSVHAASVMVLGDDAAARQSIERVEPPAFGKIVRGILALRAGDANAALADLQSDEPLAIAARALALRKLARTSEATQLLETLATTGKTESQRAWARRVASGK